MGAAVALIFASACLAAPRLQIAAAHAARPGPPTARPQRINPSRRPLTKFFFDSVSAATDLGAAYGTAKSGVGVSSMGVMKPDLVMKSIIPVVMAGVLGIYGLIIAVIIANGGTRFILAL